jgi:TonB-linked SusC/RagA family outer membrane protein
MKRRLKPRLHYKLLMQFLLVLLLFIAGSQVLMAQGISISGVVTDQSSGEILPGANVMIKGTNAGAVTDANGEYTIEVESQDAVLVFSFIGYDKKEVPVGDQTVINADLKFLAEDLEEIVVVGYGVQKKKLSTGATVNVKAEDIEYRHSLRIEQAIQGVTPGVSITANSGQPGEPLKVRIRGVGTVGDSDPLYVVDGMPTDDIRYLNPSDIESVDILKDAASAAIYGARAANGVILITTKQGQSGQMRVSYDGYYGIQNTPKKLDMLNGQQYCMIINEAAKNSGDDSVFTQADINAIGEGTNWMDYLFNENAPMQNHVVSISGGTERSLYSASLSYFKQEGIIGSEDKSQFERLSFRLNSEHKLYKDKVTFGENMVYSHSNVRGVGVGDAYDNSVRNFVNASPTYPVYSDTTADGFGRSSFFPLEVNPVGMMHYKDFNIDKYDKLLGNIYAEVDFIKGLSLTSKFGIDLSFKRNNEYIPVYELSEMERETNSTAKMGIESNFTYNFENYLTYSRAIGRHNLMLLAGNTVQEYNKFEVSGEKEDLIIEDFDFAILDNGTNDTTQITKGTKLERALLSYYGRLNYNFEEKYLFTATLRIDGSSKFGPENRYGYFPSFSAGWVISQENFFNLNWLNFLKLRASWGQNGNDKILDFVYESLIESQGMDYYFGANETKAVGSAPTQLPNPKIKWETSEQIDLGLDSRFLGGFSLAVDLYKKRTKDWLVVAPVSDLAGADAPYINGGTIENKGFEIDLGYSKYFGEFTFSVDVNLAYNKNEVLEINNDEGIIHGEASILSHKVTEFYRAEVGYPIGYFYGYKADGIFQNQEEIDSYIFVDEDGDSSVIMKSAEPGDVRWVDANNDGRINSKDKTFIGDPNPDYIYGLSFSSSYRGFDFSVFMQGVAGNQVVMGMRVEERMWNNYTTEILDRWHGEGTSNKIPRMTLEGDDYETVSDMLYIQNGDYLKIRSVNIGYDFKKSLLRSLPVEKLRIYVAANNLYTFTKYKGFDPEVGYGDYDKERPANYSTGIDIGYYPLPRTYMVGLNVNF